MSATLSGTKKVSATEANRSFSTLLREVEKGRSYLITSHGRPIALITPPPDVDEDLERRHQEFMDYLLTLPTHHIGPWTRDELYDDDDK